MRLTDTDDPDIWASEFVRLFKLPSEDTPQVSQWFESLIETAVRIHVRAVEMRDGEQDWVPAFSSDDPDLS